MPRAALLLLLLAALVPSSPCTAGDDSRHENWRRLRASGYSVVGNASDGQLRDAQRALDAFRHAMGSVLPGLRFDEPATPLTVIVFRDRRAFDPFKPRLRGKPQQGVGGYFAVRPDRALIVTAPFDEDEYTYTVIFHEYTHFIIQLNMGRTPPWLSEGLAEVYSTYHGTARDSRPILGRPIKWHLSLLRSRPLIPLEELLSANMAEIFRDEWRTRMFYAESWAFVHYLVLGDDGTRRRQLETFLAAQRAGTPLPAAFTSAFGAGFAEVQRRFDRYVRQLQWPAILVSPSPAGSVQPSIEPMGDADALQEQADLLVSLAVLDEADRLLARTRRLDPSHAAARVTRARLLMAREAPQEALDALGPGPDGEFGSSLARADALRALDRFDEAAAAYAHALRLQHRSAYAHFGLSLAYLALGRPEADASFAACLSIDPTPGWYRSRAMAALRAGIDSNVVADLRQYLNEALIGADARAYVSFAAAFTLMRQGEREAARDMLDQAVQPLDQKSWTVAVAGFLRGRLPAEQLLARASDEGERTEAHAYVGLLASIAGLHDDARPHLEWVVANGLRNYVEYGYAVGELKRLARSRAVPALTDARP